MKKRELASILFLGGMMLAGMTACTGDDDPADRPDDGVKVRRMTITQTDGAAARQVLTRATLTEDDGLTASWMAGDRLTYCNLNRTNPSNDAAYSGPLTATSTAATSQFTGDVACSKGDRLAVVYPAATFETNESYTISLTGQDGTLQTLAEKYHYIYGVAQVNSVTDQTADASMAKMKSLLTVCKFSFVDKATGDAIAIQKLAISYGGGGSDAGTYPQTATVAIGASTAQSDVHATGDASSAPLLLEGSREAFFVALLPTGGQRTFRFTVTDGSGNTYTGTAKATLTEGEYVEATGLRLTKQP
ncbi:MAG: hypothetical protein IJ551_05315 [Prevotella sp.]|nr:hypothetical protein [Prevotella sp.]